MTARGIAVRTGLGQAYDEDGLRYLLVVEQARCARSGHAWGLVLIDATNDDGAGVRIGPAVAARLFTALWGCVRASDVIGWYRHGRVAAVLLTALDPAEGPATCERVMCRIDQAIRRQLPGAFARHLRLRLAADGDRGRRGAVAPASARAQSSGRGRLRVL